MKDRQMVETPKEMTDDWAGMRVCRGLLQDDPEVGLSWYEDPSKENDQNETPQMYDYQGKA